MWSILGRLLLFVGTRPIATAGRLVGGAVTTGAVAAGVDQAATGGEGRRSVWENLTGKFNEVVGDRAKDETFELIAPIMGWDAESEEDRNQFDEWWNTIEPGAFGATLASIKGVDIALDRVLGLDLLSNKQVMIAAIGYHLLVTKGYGAQALNWVKEQGWAKDLGIDEGIAGVSAAVRDGIGNFNGQAAGQPAQEEAASTTTTPPEHTIPVPEPAGS